MKKIYYFSDINNTFCSGKSDDSYEEIDFAIFEEYQEKIKTCDFSYNKKTKKFIYTKRIIDYIPILKSQAKQELIGTDFIMVTDTFEELSEDKQKQLLAYRKYLRNVMNDIEDISNADENTKLKEIGDL